MSRSSTLIAGIAVLGLAGWLASGFLAEPEGSADARPSRAEPQPPLVEVAMSTAQPVTRHIIAQGDVEAFRRAAARTQTEGRVAEILVTQGERISAGQPLMRLTLEGRGSRLREARVILDRREQDYEAAATLLERGFTTQANVRELQTLLESAREEVQRLEDEVANTIVKAPFAAVIDSVDVEPGQYVTANAAVATLIDNTPLRINVRVNQRDIARVQAGLNAEVLFATGQSEIGRVCFVSAAASPETRTFRVEIRTPNAANAIPSGVSAEARVPTGIAQAHFVSPALLSLGTNGSLGLKTVDDDGIVAFHEVDVIRAQTDGVWIGGLPEEVRLITIGQGFVQAGDKVRTAETDAIGRVSASIGTGGSLAPDVVDLPEAICAREPAADAIADAQDAADVDREEQPDDDGSAGAGAGDRPGQTEQTGGPVQRTGLSAGPHSLTPVAVRKPAPGSAR